LVRINFATLQANGLVNVSAENFQLFRNGEEVAIYTSVAAGVYLQQIILNFGVK
jgi:hypothetical protein